MYRKLKTKPSDLVQLKHLMRQNDFDMEGYLTVSSYLPSMALLIVT